MVTIHVLLQGSTEDDVSLLGFAAERVEGAVCHQGDKVGKVLLTKLLPGSTSKHA